MAQGTFTLFEEFSANLGAGVHNFSADSFKVALVTTLPLATLATPALGDLTEVAGTGYTAGGVALTTSYVEAGGVSTFDASTNPTWTQNGAGPANIVSAVVYNDTNVGKELVGFVDMTTDAGATAVSTQNGDITITWNASGLFTITV